MASGGMGALVKKYGGHTHGTDTAMSGGRRRRRGGRTRRTRRGGRTRRTRRGAGHCSGAPNHHKKNKRGGTRRRRGGNVNNLLPFGFLGLQKYLQNM